MDPSVARSLITYRFRPEVNWWIDGRGCTMEGKQWLERLEEQASQRLETVLVESRPQNRVAAITSRRLNQTCPVRHCRTWVGTRTTRPRRRSPVTLPLVSGHILRRSVTSRSVLRSRWRMTRMSCTRQCSGALLRSKSLPHSCSVRGRSSQGHWDARDIDEISGELATLKTLPPRPAQRPAEAIGAQGKLSRFGEKVLQGLAVAEAKDAITAASKTLWANYGDRLLDLAHAIGDWLASLPPP